MKRLSLFLISLLWLAGVLVPVAAVFGRLRASSVFFAELCDPVVIHIARVTAGQALLSTLISIALGLPLGLAVAKSRGRVQKATDILMMLPYGVPSIVAGMAWILWLGRSGALVSLGIPLDWNYSLRAVILAHVFFNLPWVALLTARARRGLPEEQLEAASLLGAGEASRLRFVILPQVRWAVASAGAQVFALCSMSFALVLILGGGPPVQTLETALYSRMRYGMLDIDGAAACAAWELVITLAPWILVSMLRSRKDWVITEKPAQLATDGAGWVALGVAAILFAPYLILIFHAPWARLLRPGVLAQIHDPIWVSVRLAVFCAIGVLIAVALALLGLEAVKKLPRVRAWVTLLLGIPSGISVLVLGLGFWLAYGRWIDPFEGSLGAMAALQVTLFFPIAFRMLWPVAQAGQPEALEAAATLGAGPFQVFRFVEWPRWRGPILSSAALVAGASLGEVAAVSLFYSEKLIPLPLMISRWMAKYRFDDAQVISAVLLVLAVGTIACVSVLGVESGQSRVREGGSE